LSIPCTCRNKIKTITKSEQTTWNHSTTGSSEIEIFSSDKSSIGIQIKNQKKPRTVNTFNRKEAVHARGREKPRKIIGETIRKNLRGCQWGLARDMIYDKALWCPLIY